MNDNEENCEIAKNENEYLQEEEEWLSLSQLVDSYKKSVENQEHLYENYLGTRFAKLIKSEYNYKNIFEKMKNLHCESINSLETIKNYENNMRFKINNMEDLVNGDYEFIRRHIV